MFRLSLILAASLLLFFSCKKEKDLPDAPGDRLKMIRYKEGDSISFRSFQYDVQNRLTAVVDSGHGGIYRRDISYDIPGNLLRIDINGDIITFDFNNEGRVIRKKSIVPGQQSPTVRNTYVYDIFYLFAGITLPVAAVYFLAKSFHLLQNTMHIRHYVFAITQYRFTAKIS